MYRLVGDLSSSYASLSLSASLKERLPLGALASIGVSKSAADESHAETLSLLGVTAELMGRKEEAADVNRRAMRIFHEMDWGR